MRAKSPAHFLPVAVLFVWVLMAPQTASQDRGLELTSPPQTNLGRYYALVIGNNAYQSVPRLKTAESDARGIEAILKGLYGFQTKLLLNATRQQIVSAMNAYRRELDSESNLLIYYAGHGVFDKEIDKAYWLPVDASQHDNSNWISADDITSNIKGIPAKHVMIVSDSCYSGTLTRGIGVAVSEPALRERYLQKMMAGKSRTLMASGGNEPVVDGMGAGNHSVFASALMRGLTRMEMDRFTAAELYREFVEESVAGSVNQTPEYNPLRNSGHESGDFVFVRIRKVEKTDTGTGNKRPLIQPIDPTTIELSFWDSIKNSTDPEDFKDYLTRYPAGQFASLAERRLKALTASTAISHAAEPVPTPVTTTEAPSAREYDQLMSKAAMAAGAGNSLEAIRLYTEATATDTSKPEPYERLGDIYWKMSEQQKKRADFSATLDKALQAYRRAIELGGKASFAVEFYGGSFGKHSISTLTITSSKISWVQDKGEFSYEGDRSSLFVEFDQIFLHIWYKGTQVFKATGKGDPRRQNARFFIPGTEVHNLYKHYVVLRCLLLPCN